MSAKINKAVIPVAGLGTRMLPATKAIPKELVPVYDRPIIEHVVKEAIAGGVTEIILVTRSGKEAIENHFDAHYELEHRLEKKGKETILGTVKNIIPEHVKVTSIRQADALGLGHAVLCAKHLLNNEPFAVLLPDVLVLDSQSRDQNYSFARLVEAWDKTQVGQVMVESVDSDMIENYGVADLDGATSKPFDSIALKGLVEKPLRANAPSNLAIIGRYILMPEVFDHLAEKHPGAGGEIQLTDALAKMVNSMPFYGLRFEGRRFDCGDKVGFLEANLAFALDRDDMKTDVEKLVKLYT
mgnify:CR=1 FL=1